jgi:chorismate synthase
MAGNSFGTLFKITTYGESHGVAMGVVIDGCPAGISIDSDAIQDQLDRRRPGQSAIVTQRKEADTFEIVSGIFENQTTGTPISLVIRNKDQKSRDYDHIKSKYRPSHADFTYDSKYGFRDYRGGGRSSARETVARVAAGAIAMQILSTLGIHVAAYVSQVGEIAMNEKARLYATKEVDATDVRCPIPGLAEKMIQHIREIRKQGDTIGGMITCVAQGVPPGIGEPVFDKLHADLAKAMLSINAVKGFEYGSGFQSVTMRGSDHNDHFYKEDGRIKTKTNYSGGIQGGISNGMEIYFNVAFKPVATLMQEVPSIDQEGNPTTMHGKGRHDPCVVPRAVPIVESMAALVILDHILRSRVNKASDLL